MTQTATAAAIGEDKLSRRPRWLNACRKHWPIVVVLTVAGILLFTNLRMDRLWADEGDTAVLARNILKFGVPTAWDGVTFTDSDFGTRLNDKLVMVSHPWLQYYVTALSFALFGDTTLGARLPFALFGLATIALIYIMLIRVARNQWAGIAAAILLSSSVQFLIYARQSRHYSLTALLACLLLFQFTRLTSWASSLRFALLASLLFHSHPMGLTAMGGLAVLTALHPAFRSQRVWFWRAAPLVAALTLPWFFMVGAGYSENTAWLGDVGTFLPRVGQFAIECASVTSIVGTAVLFFVVRRRARARARPALRSGRSASPRATVFTTEERSLAVPLIAMLLTYAVAMAVTQSREMIWQYGIRYTSAVMPLCAMLAGIAIAKASRGRWQAWVALVVVFGFTRAGQITPWAFWAQPSPKRDREAVVTFHNPERVIDRVLRTTQVGYLKSLIEPNPGTIARVAEFLTAHAAPNDVVITNYEWEPLYFYTRLPQGMKVLPSYPIWSAAKAHELPSYVFSAKGVRWIVWRQAWGAYRGQACDRIIKDVQDQGASVVALATVPETLWENRENIHFRRFPGNRYYYSWHYSLPPTLIFRVEWPETEIATAVGGSQPSETRQVAAPTTQKSASIGR
jgi:4-amino-4-deoxy-L-arabinose transferase-like glycosyltransferase